MNEAAPMAPPVSPEKPLAIAILAMGGQGGGVLADWIVEVAEHEGWAAQSTSVPGVAQRSGATISYIATLPPGDGVGDPFVVVDALDFAARRTIAFDMEKLAVERGTVISAAMLGALAGSGALPFERSAYEAIVNRAARGANASLAAFADAYDRAREGKNEAPNTGPAKRLDELPGDAGHPELNRLVARLRSDLPESARPLAFAGLKRIVDFQDVAYGDDYIDRLKKLAT